MWFCVWDCACMLHLSHVPLFGSPPGSSVPGTLQTRILKWVVISHSRGCSQPIFPTHFPNGSFPKDWTSVSCISRRILYHWVTWEAGMWDRVNRVRLLIIAFFCFFFGCCCLVAKLCPTLLWPYGLYLVTLFCPRNFPGKIIGMGCHFPLQSIILIQGLNAYLLHCRQILYHCVTVRGGFY